LIAQATLETAQSSLVTRTAELAIATEATSSLQIATVALGNDLESRLAENEQNQRELSNCRSELAAAQAAVLSTRSALESAEHQADDAAAQLAELVEVENLLVAARSEVDQLKATLGEMEALEFGARQERDQAREERDAARERIGAVEAELQAAEEAQR
jgi:chromosome segregation ATPase